METVYINKNSLIFKFKLGWIRFFTGCFNFAKILPQYMGLTVDVIRKKGLPLFVLYGILAVCLLFAILLLSPLTNLKFISLPQEFNASFSVAELPFQKAPGLDQGMPALLSLIISFVFFVGFLYPACLLIRAILLTLEGKEWNAVDLLFLINPGRILRTFGSIAFSYLALFFIGFLCMVAFSLGEIGAIGKGSILFFGFLILIFFVKWNNIFALMAYEELFFNEALARSGEISSESWYESFLVLLLAGVMIWGGWRLDGALVAKLIGSETSYAFNLILRLLLFGPLLIFGLIFWQAHFLESRKKIKNILNS